MAHSRRTVRTMVLGITLGLAVVAGASACGSSTSKTNSGNTTPATNAPASPATTSPPSGGVSY